MHTPGRFLAVTGGIIVCVGVTLAAQWRVQTKGIAKGAGGNAEFTSACPEVGGRENTRPLGDLGRGETAVQRGDGPIRMPRRVVRHPRCVSTSPQGRWRWPHQGPRPCLATVGAGAG